MEVDLVSNSSPDEDYIIGQVQKLRHSDPCSAKSFIITGQTLFPKNFYIQFEAYKLEKEANNHQEAAKAFSYITLTFQNNNANNAELWHEVTQLTNALRAHENVQTPEEEFYVKMFQHVQYDVQHKILLLLTTVNQTQCSLSQCKLLLLILKRFPQAAVTHSPRLLEMIADGMKQDPQKYQELLVEEALPLIYHKTPELPTGLVCRLFTISLEYYIRHIIEEATKCDTNETWRKIFSTLMLCGKIQRWETFLPFNKTWGQNVYWDKLIEIVSSSSSAAGSTTQVLYYATTLFIYSLHSYIKNCNTHPPDGGDTNHVLVEGFTDWRRKVDGRVADAQSMEPPQISLTTPTSKDISKAFVHAAQCWQLLNTEQFQLQFSKLLRTLPLAPWISRFLFDLAIYFGHQEEAKKLMSELSVKSNLVHNLQILSLNLLQGNLTPQGFECVLKILAELPAAQGQILEHLNLPNLPRHMIFMPLLQVPLVQYCTKALINSLSRKLYEPNCSDQVMGDLLVLLQLEYPRETLMAEQIIAIITTRRSFTYRLFSAYIVTIDFIEEFMHIWHTHNEDFNFDFSTTPAATGAGGVVGGAGPQTRRIGTRGVDKGVRDDFRLAIKQQIGRANENIPTLVANFITQEQMQLMQNIFGGGGGGGGGTVPATAIETADVWC